MAKPGRTVAALAAIALGVGVVIWVTCAYESVRLALMDQVWFWIGRSHLSVESVYGSEGTVYESISSQVSGDRNVQAVTYRLKQRLMMFPVRPESPIQATSRPETELSPATRPEAPPASAGFADTGGTEVETVGIDPATEYEFRKYDDERLVGRMLTTDDTDATVMDEKLARQLDLKIGDRIRLRSRGILGRDPDIDRSATFEIVGLLNHRQVAKQQKPIIIVRLQPLQQLVGYDQEPRRVTKIDMLLKDTSKQAIRQTESRVGKIVKDHKQDFLVSSAEGKLRQVEAAEQQSGFVLLMLSCVALFTAFFIILSTLSMGMLERIGQLGTLRCLGVTRMQMAMMVLAEAVPLGFAGILLGIPVGLALARLSVWFAPEYIGQFAISKTGMVLALGGGAITTLAGALLPAAQAMRVSPLAASRPQAKPTPMAMSLLALLVGLAMIAGHFWMILRMPANMWFKPWVALGGVSLLYCGFALSTPFLVWAFGQFAVRIVAVVLRVRYRLLSDQVGRAAWRSAGICCGLMVGLSLIVSLVVHSESLAAGWDFPKDFCEAFVFVEPPISRTLANEIRKIPGVAESALVNEDISCTVYGAGLFHFVKSRFVAGDPEEFFRIAHLEFKEGNLEEAIAKLKKGGCILVTPEFVRAKKRGYGQKVYIKSAGVQGYEKDFEIVGVVTSPALDIAANYFNAGGMLVQASVFVVLGTFEDAAKVFRLPDQASMFLLNFNLTTNDGALPPEFEQLTPPDVSRTPELVEMLRRWRPLMPEREVEIDEILRTYAARVEAGANSADVSTPLLRVVREAMAKVVGGWEEMAPQQRWQDFREELVMLLIVQRTGCKGEQHASVRALKLRIDRDLRRATLLFTTIPMVALIVAALGVANLMMANVTSRGRQIAMLRAIGATRWQIVRLVTGEALVLGSLGSLLGLGLGLAAAYGLNQMTLNIWGYQPHWSIPVDLVVPGIAFTMLVCLIAGVLPARHAARNNIIDALQTT